MMIMIIGIVIGISLVTKKKVMMMVRTKMMITLSSRVIMMHLQVHLHDSHLKNHKMMMMMMNSLMMKMNSLMMMVVILMDNNLMMVMMIMKNSLMMMMMRMMMMMMNNSLKIVMMKNNSMMMIMMKKMMENTLLSRVNLMVMKGNFQNKLTLKETGLPTIHHIHHKRTLM